MPLLNSQEGSSPARACLSASRPLIIGHRGQGAVAPENTLPSFQGAISAGADLVELDCHVTADGFPVVIHDDTLDRTTDSRQRWARSGIRVRDMTASQLQDLDAGAWFDPRFAGAKVPLLSEALEMICGQGSIALIEHKSGDAATLHRVLRAGNLLDRIVVISFDWTFLRDLSRIAPEVILGALGPSERLADDLPVPASPHLALEWIERMQQTGAEVAVWNQEVSPTGVRLAHDRGLKVWVYTIDARESAIRLLAMGVDGIITNDPGSLRKSLQSD